MSHTVVFDPAALVHLEKLYRYIARNSYPSRAKTFTDSIVAYCESLAVLPNRGTQLDHLRPGLRSIGFRKRVTIAFSVTVDKVIIYGVYYRGRNVSRLVSGSGT